MQNSFDFLEIDRVLALLKPNRRLSVKPYAYPFNFAALAASGSLSTTKAIDANCDFLWVATTFSVPDYSYGYSIQIQDAGSGEFYLPQSLPFTFLGGFLQFNQSGNSDTLGFPRLIPANSNLTMTLTDITGAPASASQVALHGVRVYEYD